MNSPTTHHHHHSHSHFIPNHDDMNRIVSSAHSALDQLPPPSLREILSAYRAKGDGDRDMLLAMLNAKAAEDQRIASVSSLHKTMLEIYQHSPPPPPESSHSFSHPPINGTYQYPTPTFTHSTHPCDQPPARRIRSHPHRVTSGSRSPRMHSHHPDHPRKRHRSSHPSQIAIYESSHPSEQFPPSPYSSSGRSDSVEYSPRSRGSMTIGSLLSSGPPSRDVNGDHLPQNRD